MRCITWANGFGACVALMAALSVLASCDVLSFVGQAQPSRSLLGKVVSVSPGHGTPVARVASQGRSQTQDQKVPFAASPSIVVGALLVGATLLRQRQARTVSSISRRVTLQQIKELKIEDVPAGWRPKISLAMARRNAVVQAISTKLDDTYFIMAFNRECMLTPQLEEARAMFPDTVTVRGLKNSLVRRAMLGTPWEGFSKALKGSNMYIFVKEDVDLKATIQAYIKMEKKFKRVDVVASIMEKAGDAYQFQLKPCTGGCLRDEWNLITYEDIPKLKDFPTKTELIGKIAGSIKQVTTKLARSIKQVPQKIAIGTKKIVEKMEEEGKSIVGDAVA